MARFTCILSICGALLPLIALQAEIAPLPKRLATTSSALRYGIVLGRLQAIPLQPGLTQNCSLETEASKSSERLSVSPQDRGISIRYELSSPSEEFLFESTAEGAWLLRREPRGDSKWPRCEFVQPATGSLTLTIGDTRHTEPTIWHLLLTHRSDCREHLTPLLEAIQPGWDVDWQAERLAAALAARRPEDMVAAADVEKLVNQLAEGKYAVRRAAVIELEKLGPRCLLAFSALDARQLEREQVAILNHLRARIASEGSDTPERTAAWLQADPNI